MTTRNDRSTATHISLDGDRPRLTISENGASDTHFKKVNYPLLKNPITDSKIALGILSSTPNLLPKTGNPRGLLSHEGLGSGKMRENKAASSSVSCGFFVLGQEARRRIPSHSAAKFVTHLPHPSGRVLLALADDWQNQVRSLLNSPNSSNSLERPAMAARTRPSRSAFSHKERLPGRVAILHALLPGVLSRA